MVSVLLSILVLAGLGIIIPFVGLIGENTYGSKLEEYITSRNPQDTADVERYTREFQIKEKSFL
jgi:hypothetical protein